MDPWWKTKRLSLVPPAQQELFVRWQQLLNLLAEPYPPLEWQ